MLRTNNQWRSAFTLIELIIVIGIIGTLASVTLVAISPNKQLTSTRDTTRLSAVKELQNAISQYVIDNGSFPTGVPVSPAAPITICKQGMTAGSCLSLDAALVPKYIVALPQDALETNVNHSGYMVVNKSGRPEVTAAYLTEFNPKQIAGLTFWLTPEAGVFKDAGVTAAANTDTVQQWNDQSGNGYNLTQATAGKRPTLLTGIRNGKPVIRFDGVDDAIAAVATTLPQPMTIFLVGKNTLGTFFDSGDVSANRLIIDKNGGSSIWRFYASTNITGGTADTNYHVFTAVANGASSLLEVDTTQVASGNPGASSFTIINLGSLQGGVNVPLTGDIAEILIYNSALSSTNRQLVKTYLNNRYTIY